MDKVTALGPDGPIAELTRLVHQLSGLAGTIGFPTVSARAAELEILAGGAGNGAFDAVRGDAVADVILKAFNQDLSQPSPAHDPTRALATLPVNLGNAEPRRRAEDVKAPTILLAEDEPDQRAIVTSCLVDAGYTAVAVVSGDQVVAAARAEKPAVILLDIAMPRLDGYSVCRLLKADPELAHIPVIFMTTGANLDDKLLGLMLGADEFLNKPVDMRELVLRIGLLLKRCPPRAAAPAAAERAVAAVAARTVVIAEDDPDVTHIIDAQLRAAGYKAILAFDGEQALAAVTANAADVLVLDLMMPNLNGFDVLGLIRQSPPPRPRIIVLSGRGREEDVTRAFELGADDYMTKPFNPQELLARIARLLK